MPTMSPAIHSVSSASAASEPGNVPDLRQHIDAYSGQAQSTFKQAFAAQLERSQSVDAHARPSQRNENTQEENIRKNTQDRHDASSAQKPEREHERANETASYADRAGDQPSKADRDSARQSASVDEEGGSAAARDYDDRREASASSQERGNKDAVSKPLEGDSNSAVESEAGAELVDDAMPAGSSLLPEAPRADELEAGLVPFGAAIRSDGESPYPGQISPLAMMASSEHYKTPSTGGPAYLGGGGLLKGAELAPQAALLSGDIDVVVSGEKTALGAALDGLGSRSASALGVLQAGGDSDAAKLSVTSLQSQAMAGQPIAGQAGHSLLGRMNGEASSGLESFSATMTKGLESQLAGGASLSDDSGGKFSTISAGQGLVGGANPAVAGRLQMPVNIAFGQSGWAELVADRSAMMAAQSIKFAEIQLDPPELGQLQVKVSVNQDQASVSFVAPNAQVKDALDQTIARLKEMLQEQGLNLQDVDVSDHSSSGSSDEEALSQNSSRSIEGEDSEEQTEVQQGQVLNAHYGVDHYA